MPIASQIASMLGAVFVDKSTPDKSSARHFVPTKGLCEKDCIIVDMLNSQGHESVAYCVCDPALADNPIVFASDGFCSLTGYEYDDIQGRNCRFLQGPQTNKEQVDRIRNSIQKQTEQSVNLLNYRKDGSTFVNEFFLTPLRDEQNNVQYFLGVQCQVARQGQGQAPSNPGFATGFLVGGVLRRFFVGILVTGFLVGILVTGFLVGTLATGFVVGILVTGYLVGILVTGFLVGIFEAGVLIGAMVSSFLVGILVPGTA